MTGTTNRHGFYILGSVDRFRDVEGKAKDGSAFTKHELHITVRGESKTVTYPIVLKNPEKFKHLKPNELVLIEIFGISRVYNNQVYTTYYAVDCYTGF